MGDRVYYDCSDNEVKTCTDPDEAIDEYLQWFDSVAEMPEEVTASAFNILLLTRRHQPMI